ncbi:MAG TPA: SRPBCC domain-containing protein [Longimicrobiales bacterium]|nr:SRPBCC domain-containing protein [Longimicrobiales bacterium]
MIRARPAEIYQAFMDPDALVSLPPGDMTGTIHEFERRAGGGYRMSLFYPEHDQISRGKTSEREDMVTVRVLELVPARRIVQSVTFHTTDPDLAGEMTMVWTIEQLSDGSEVTVLCQDLPPGLRPEDNEAGSRLSLEQLARRVERPAG